MNKFFICLLVCAACQTNEADFPEIETSNAREIGSNSVLLEANMKEIGPIKPMNYGFVWSENPSVNILSADKYVVGSASGPILYSIKPDTFDAGTTYYYRGFAANADYSKIYYGNEVGFTTLP